MTPEEIAAEEARAALWRRQQVRRVQFQSALWNSLAGSPVGWRVFMARWQALIDYLAEREEPEGEPDLEIDPLGISDTVNVGE